MDEERSTSRSIFFINFLPFVVWPFGNGMQHLLSSIYQNSSFHVTLWSSGAPFFSDVFHVSSSGMIWLGKHLWCISACREEDGGHEFIPAALRAKKAYGPCILSQPQQFPWFVSSSCPMQDQAFPCLEHLTVSTVAKQNNCSARWWSDFAKDWHEKLLISSRILIVLAGFLQCK